MILEYFRNLLFLLTSVHFFLFISNIIFNHFSARHSSYLLCYVGLVFSMVQGGGLKAFLKRFSEGKLILLSSFMLSLSLLWWSGSVTHAEIMLSLFPLSLASGLLNTLINSEITKQVEQVFQTEFLSLLSRNSAELWGYQQVLNFIVSKN